MPEIKNNAPEELRYWPDIQKHWYFVSSVEEKCKSQRTTGTGNSKSGD